MTTPTKNQSKDKIEKIESLMNFSIALAVSIFLIVLGLYFYKFGDMTLAETKADWGTFGDFVGGLLNPTIAALALYWLISSVKLQIEELKETNKALSETVETAKKQQNQVSLQNFESLFFQLLKNKTEVTKDIVLIGQQYNTSYYFKSDSFSGKDAFKGCIHHFKSSQKDKVWEDYYREELLDYFGSYFRVCYQIVKIIDQNESLKTVGKVEGKGYSLKQKEYFDIFRATLTQHELETFFFNCLSMYGNGKFKNLIEKFGMFEPLLMDFNYPTEQYHRLSNYAYQYKRETFEENPNWKRYFDELEAIEINCDQELIKKNIKLILELELHLEYDKGSLKFLSLEELNNLILNKIRFYSKKFNEGVDPYKLSTPERDLLMEFKKLKQIKLDYEVYICIKYGIDISKYIEYRKLKKE
ncbi:TPA: putative phage abortive infection protein [Acinetobacter baumannii]|nr:putative phage abortive infection protein [Acinetobacter baumannii]